MVELSKIQKDVRIVLDHNEIQESVFHDDEVEDQLQLDDIIENQVNAGSRLTMLMSPRSYINWEVLTDTGASGDGYYAVPIPQDFLRMGAAKMTDWAKAVDVYGLASDEEYTMQQSEFAGVRATRRKPLAFLCEKPEGGNEMQLYPLKTGGDTLQFFTYCKQQVLTENATTGEMEMDISDTLYQPFIYITAALVAEVLKDTDKNNELMTAARLMMAIPEEATTEVQEQN